MHLHGFHHVDGDYPLKSCGSNERYRSMTETMLEASICYAPRGEDGPEELWTPYFTEIAHLALKAVQKSDEERRAHARDSSSGVPRKSRKHIDGRRWIGPR